MSFEGAGGTESTEQYLGIDPCVVDQAVEAYDLSIAAQTEELDDYASSDIIPFESDTTEAPNESAGHMSPTQYKYLVIDEKGNYSERPDGQIALEMRAAADRLGEQIAEQRTILDDPSRQVHAYDDYKDLARQELTEDFGARGRALPLAVISCEEALKINGDSIRKHTAQDSFPLGWCIDGCGYAVEHPDYIAIAGPEFVFATLLHEGAHASATDDTQVIVARRIAPDDKAAEQKSRGRGFTITRHHTLGLCDYDPSTNAARRIFEEGFATSYMVRKLEKHNLAPSADNRSDLLNVSTEKYRTFFTPTDEISYAYPNMITLPWKYARGIQYAADGTPRPLTNHNTYAGALVDLLDTHIPGLYEAMLVSRTEPEAKKEVRAMVDDRYPDLYATIGRLPMNTVMHGLACTAQTIAAAKRRTIIT